MFIVVHRIFLVLIFSFWYVIMPGDDVLHEDRINYRMVRSHYLLSLSVLVAIGVGRRIQNGNEMRESN
jgi:hypothetical protein